RDRARLLFVLARESAPRADARHPGRHIAPGQLAHDQRLDQPATQEIAGPGRNAAAAYRAWPGLRISWSPGGGRLSVTGRIQPVIHHKTAKNCRIKAKVRYSNGLLIERICCV